MFDPTDIRPGQLTLRVEAVAGLQPIWVMAMGPHAEEFARLAVEALRGEISRFKVAEVRSTGMTRSIFPDKEPKKT